MARVASQKTFLKKNDIFAFVSTILSFFHILSNRKRRALKFCEDLSNFQPVNSDLRPFGWCPYQNNPRLSWSLQLESEKGVAKDAVRDITAAAPLNCKQGCTFLLFFQTSTYAGIVLVPTSSKNARNGLRSEFTGWKFDRSSQNFNARLFRFEKMWKNDHMVKKNAQMSLFVKKNLWEATRAIPKL